MKLSSEIVHTHFCFVFGPENTRVWSPTLRACGGLTVNLEGLGFPYSLPCPHGIKPRFYCCCWCFPHRLEECTCFYRFFFLLLSELELVVKDRLYFWSTSQKAKKKQTEKPNQTKPNLTYRTQFWNCMLLQGWALRRFHESERRILFYFSFFFLIHKISSSN